MSPRTPEEAEIAGTPHFEEDLIERFLACEVTRAENRAVVRHLLSDCPDCKAKIWRRWRPAPGADFETALVRVMEAWTARARKACGQVVPFRQRALDRKERA